MPNVERVEGNLFVMYLPAARARRRQLAEYYFKSGMQAESLRGPNNADEWYEKALDSDPLYTPALINLGVLRHHQGDLSAAETYYRAVLKINERYPLAHFDLGNCLDEMGKIDEAIAHYLRAISLAPTYADAHFNLAYVYEKKGDLRKVVLHYRLYLKYETDGTDIDRWKAQTRIEEVMKREPLRIVSKNGERKKQTRQKKPPKLSLVAERPLT